MNPLSRRQFMANASLGLAGAAFAVKAASAAPITLPPFNADTERKSDPPPEPLPPSERVGFAVVGLGRLALEEIIPAFAQCKKAKLTALVSGSPDKAAAVAKEHGIDSIYDYKTYDRLRDNPAVQVIYVVLPNGLHAEYTVRGAEAGKHILCEKPMANTAAECEQMIAACEKAARKLMIAYRIQYEPSNALLRRFVREHKYGAVKFIESVNGQMQGDPSQWRQKKALAGGGALPDVGLYCLNTIRYLLGEEPVQVSGTTYSTPGDPRFKEVEESVSFQLRFPPSGITANCATSYGFHESRRYRVYAETGWFGMDPAFSYQGLRMETSHAEGKLEIREQPALTPKNQFALEMDHMADCVLRDRKPFTPGEEGLQDQRLMEAIYLSAASEGKPVPIPAGDGKLDRFRGDAPESNT